MEQKAKLLRTLLDSNAFLKAEKELIMKAYNIADNAHKGQFRKSGDPYVCHTLSTGIILSKIGMNANTVAAGVLHDVLEDTEITEEELTEQIGADVTFLVKGVTKLEQVRYQGFERHIKSLQRLFVSTAKDPRVIIIKLCDRLHNMRTLNYLPPEKRSRIAEETLYVYVPLAEKLGISKLKVELADIAFKYLHPKEYEETSALIKEKTKDGDIYLSIIKLEIEKRIKRKYLVSITSRIKSVYSYWVKLKHKQDVEQIHDLFALTVIVKDVPQCYEVMGVIHTLWHPLRGRIKDYIASPKPNGYQSLHTDILVEGKIVEIQIRTSDMQQMAQYGLASHYSYKYQKNDFLRILPIPTFLLPREEVSEKKVPKWLEELGIAFEQMKEDEHKDIFDEHFKENIFVYTPKRDVVELPHDATPIDFAYRVHTSLGNHIKQAFINGKLSSLDTRLHNGDVVEIQRAKTPTVTKKWLDIVILKEVKRKIQNHLSKQ